MNMESRDKYKRYGIKRFFNSFRYSYQGLKYTYKYEQSMFIHILITIVVVILGILLKISTVEWFICLILIALVIASELINTAIEAVVDLASPKVDPLAKIAKDTASAAVFILSLASFICGLIIFVPKLF